MNVNRQHRFPRALLALLLAIMLAAAPLVAFATPEEGPAGGRSYAPDRFLVKFAPGAAADEVAELNAKHGVREKGRVNALGVRILSVPAGRSVDGLVRAYRNNPNVVYAEPDYIVSASLVPNDPHYPLQWGSDRVLAPAAWDVSTGSPSVTIAIVDTGVNAAHPDLAGRVVGGYDYVNADADASDDNGHGTMCAGVAGATGNNGRGVAGMDWAAAILPVKVLDAMGNGYTSTVANGIVYAADRGARVISLSLGSSAGTATMLDAVNYAFNKGSLLVAASGNNATGSVSYPAAYANVLAVGATDRADALAPFSNFGAALDVVAPGVDIATTSVSGGYVYFSGTSAATPYVAGLASLVLATAPGITNTQAASAICSAAVDLGEAGWDQRFGWGRINAGATLAAVAPVAPDPQPEPEPEPEPVDTVAPQVAITSPVSGATVRNTVTIRAAASDNVGVTRVEFFVNGVPLSVDATAPFEVLWDTTKVANATYSLTAVAYDAAGNAGRSAAVSVKVANKTTPPGKAK